MRNRLFFVLMVIGIFSCKDTRDPLTRLIEEDQRLGSIAANPQFEVQVIYTQIDRDSLNNPSFTTYEYQVDDSTYFYPASTVKLPAVLASLEKLKKLGIPANARMEIDSAFSGQSAVRFDSSASDLQPSVAQYTKKILLTSDNDAFNRLYEFLGQDSFNLRMKAGGYTQTRMSHRLSIFLTPEENARTNPIRLYINDSLVYDQPEQVASKDYISSQPIKRGVGYQSDGEIVNEPFDFSRKNNFPLTEQHELMLALVFPQSFPERAFDLRPEDRSLVLKYMSMVPGASEIEAYQDADQYWDTYVKFLMYGSVPGVQIPKNIRIYNKVGNAYGYAIDNAYIIDTDKGIEFVLTAIIHANPNRVFNDGIYGYENIAFPFLARLGQLIFELEADRSRKHLPDFSELL